MEKYWKQLQSSEYAILILYCGRDEKRAKLIDYWLCKHVRTSRVVCIQPIYINGIPSKEKKSCTQTFWDSRLFRSFFGAQNYHINVYADIYSAVKDENMTARYSNVLKICQIERPQVSEKEENVKNLIWILSAASVWLAEGME